jgi:hypothetical protein
MEPSHRTKSPGTPTSGDAARSERLAFLASEFPTLAWRVDCSRPNPGSHAEDEVIEMNLSTRRTLVAVFAAAFVAAIGCSDTGDEGSTTSSSGPGAGSGSASGPGGGSPQACPPGDAETCYTGPEGTEGVGPCKAGVRTCEDGQGYGACEGEVTPRARNCKTPAIDEACTGDPEPCEPPVFAKLYPGVGPQHGTSVATDATGNVFFTGYSDGDVDLGAGRLHSDVFIAKTDPVGNLLWQRDIENGWVRSVAIDGTGAAILVGGFHDTLALEPFEIDVPGGAFFIAKLEPDGSAAWAREFAIDTRNEWAELAVALTPSDELVITGAFQGSVDFGGSSLTSADGYDVFVAKFDASGQTLWAKSFGGAGDQFGVQAAVDSFGNIVLTGSFEGSIDFGAGALVADDMDLYLAKLDPSGNAMWSQGIGGPEIQWAGGVAIDASGAVAVTGFHGAAVLDVYDDPPPPSACFVRKVSEDGERAWERAFSCVVSAFVPLGPRVVADTSEGFVVAGGFYGTADFGGGPVSSLGGDIMVIRLNADGEPAWFRTFGSVAGDAAMDVAIAPDGNVVITGTASGEIDFGAGLLPYSGQGDVFLVRFVP